MNDSVDTTVEAPSKTTPPPEGKSRRWDFLKGPRKSESPAVTELDSKEKKIIRLAKNSQGVMGFGIIIGNEGNPRPWIIAGGTPPIYEGASGLVPEYRIKYIPPDKPGPDGISHWKEEEVEVNPGVPKVLRKYGYEKVAIQLEQGYKGHEEMMNPGVIVATSNSQDAYIVHGYEAPLHTPATLPDFVPFSIGYYLSILFPRIMDYIRKQRNEKVLETDGTIITSSDGKITQIEGLTKALISFEVDMGKRWVSKFDEGGRMIFDKHGDSIGSWEPIPLQRTYIIINYNPDYQFPPVPG